MPWKTRQSASAVAVAKFAAASSAIRSVFGSADSTTTRATGSISASSPSASHIQRVDSRPLSWLCPKGTARPAAIAVVSAPRSAAGRAFRCSRTARFFFCGMIEEVIAIRSGKASVPNSKVAIR